MSWQEHVEMAREALGLAARQAGSVPEALAQARESVRAAEREYADSTVWAIARRAEESEAEFSQRQAHERAQRVEQARAKLDAASETALTKATRVWQQEASRGREEGREAAAGPSEGAGEEGGSAAAGGSDDSR